MKRLFLLPALAVALMAGPSPDPEFLDNGVVRIGIDRSAGGSIFHFGPSGGSALNLLNHFDKGRFIQQSYYGREDGSKWAGKPWRWNPVQGGGYKGEPADDVRITRDGDSLRIVSKPHHWATGEVVGDAEMESVITLRGPVAEIAFSFRYKGAESHPPHHQEMPAVFVDADYPNLVFGAGGEVVWKMPGWPNERVDATDHWAGYVDGGGWGLGVFFPGTTEMTCYRYKGDGRSGPTGSACSYFAPVRTLAVTPGFELNYKVYLTVGTVDEMRARFAEER